MDHYDALTLAGKNYDYDIEGGARRRTDSHSNLLGDRSRSDLFKSTDALSPLRKSVDDIRSPIPISPLAIHNDFYTEHHDHDNSDRKKSNTTPTSAGSNNSSVSTSTDSGKKSSTAAEMMKQK